MSNVLPRIDFYTARDGRRLVARVWNSIDPPRARVVFLHGVTSHGGWYYRSCHYLNTRGFEVHFLDRRGSGLNALERGDVDRHETWIDDVAVYLDQLTGKRQEAREAGGEATGERGEGRAERQGADSLSPLASPLSPRSRPVVLCGISWGGKLATAVVRRHPGLVRGLALLCPGLYSRFEPNAVQRVALAVPVPQRAQRRRVEIPLRPASLFTDTPRWREYVDRDPLSLRDVTMRFARADRRLTRLARGSASYIHTPMLLMLGGRDRIVANRRTRSFLSRTSAVHKTIIEYPNAAHTLEFESDPQQYFADLADWLGRTIAT